MKQNRPLAFQLKVASFSSSFGILVYFPLSAENDFTSLIPLVPRLDQ